MRGGDQQPEAMFSYVSMEDRIPQDHPLRAMRDLMDAALRDMSPRFTLLYAKTGRPSIPPRSSCARSCSSSCTRFGASGC